MSVTIKEKREAEKYAKSLYDNVLSVKIEENPDDSTELLLKITRGVVLPPVKFKRDKDNSKRKK